MVSWWSAAETLHYCMTHQPAKVIYWAQDEDRALTILKRISFRKRDLSGLCCYGVALFLLENIYGSARRFPFQLHGAAGAGLVERNREVLKWRRQLGNFRLVVLT
jgi:hypothetical protein